MTLTTNDINTPTKLTLSMIDSALRKVNTSMPVIVMKVDLPNNMVSVQPLIDMLDNQGKAVKHALINNIPYTRLQAGSVGLIIDPQVGDKGLVVFAARDISNIRHSSVPASWRKFSISDAIYIASLLYEEPKTYIKISADEISIKAPIVKIEGDVDITGKVTTTGDVVAGKVSLQQHIHGNGNNGADTTPPKG